MDFLDLVKSEGTRLFAYTHDLGVFVRRPRLYLSQVASLDTTEMIRRVVFYGLTPTVIELVIMGMVFRSSNLSSLEAPLTVLVVAMIETIPAFIFVPAFWLTARLLKRKDGLKLSIHYIVISRFIIIVSGMLLTALFLITEEYAFAVVRAVVYYFCLFAFLLIFPCALSGSFKKGAGAVLICLVILFATSFGLTVLIETFKAPTDQIKRFNVLYDPIGEEVQGLDIDSSTLSEFDPTLAVVADVSRLGLENLKLEQEKLEQEQKKRKLELEKLRQEQEKNQREIEKLEPLIEKLMQKLQNPKLKIAIPNLQLGNPKLTLKNPEPNSEGQEQSQPPISVPSFAEMVQSKHKGKWEEIKKQRLDEIEFVRKRLEEQRPKLVFRTSKRFVDRRLKQTDLYRSIVLSVDLLLKDPSSDRVSDWLKALNSIQEEIREIELAVTQEYLNHLETYVTLLKWRAIM